MEDLVLEEKARFDGTPVKVIGPNYAPGKPAGEEEGRWLRKLRDKDEILRYLKTAERYWYNKDWYGSERRKNPA